MSAPGSPEGAPPVEQPIRLAATVLLLREAVGGGPFEVLMVRRSRGAAFMADAFVFPGGKLDPSDGGDYVLAAAREAFEEAGVLLALDEAGRSADNAAPWCAPARHSVGQGTRSFAELLALHRLTLSSELVYFARWITPRHEARRFDARFFIARTPAGQDAFGDPAGEVVEHRWATPRAFLDEEARGRIKLPPPTLWHLTDLAALPSVEAALAWARGRQPVAVRPQLHSVDEGIAILLPWDERYDPSLESEGEPIPADSPVARQVSGLVSRYLLLDGRWVPRAHYRS